MTIKILVNASEMELTPHLKEYVEKKLGKLGKFLDSVEEAKVDLKYKPSVRNPADRHVAQFTVRGKHLLLRAEVRSEDMYASIDAGLDKLQRQIEKFKGKHFRGRTVKDPKAPEREAAHSEEPAEPVGGLIVRRKKFQVDPMTAREAVDQMQLVGHEEFFLFQNVENGALNLIYRRRDGTYGLLEPILR